MIKNLEFRIRNFGFLNSCPLILLLVGAGLLVYFPVFTADLFWDDDDFIVENVYVKDWSYFPKFFTENVIAGAGLVSDYWRPLLLTVFAFEWHLWGNWSFGYHAMNVLFHCFNGILLYFFLRKLFKKPLLAFLLALVFLIHPVQTEAVSYANSFGDSLSVFFIFLGLVCYLKVFDHYRSRMSLVWYGGSFVCYILALLSKETAIIMPFLLVLVELFIRKQQTDQLPFRQFFCDLILRLLPFFLLGMIYTALRATVFNFKNTFNLYGISTVYTDSVAVRLFTFLRVLTVYVSLLVMPVQLHMERSVDFATTFFELDVIAGVLMVSILFSIALFLYVYQRDFRALFGIGWFFVGLAPVSGILVPINGILYEHWLYLSQIGFFLFLAVLFSYLISFFMKRTVLFGTAVCVFILLFFTVQTVKRNVVWRDPIVFYRQTLDYAPWSVRVWNNLGMEYAERGDFVHAKYAYLRARALDPGNPTLHYNLSRLYVALGDKEMARTELDAALALNPDFLRIVEKRSGRSIR